jgi:CheY-like chemotaxis protein
MVKSYHSRIDLVLMDYEMPEKNGCETIKDIREFEENNHLHEIQIACI